MTNIDFLHLLISIEVWWIRLLVSW